MNKKIFLPVLATFLLAALIYSSIAWQANPGQKTTGAITDTLPEKRKKPQNMDEVLAELEQARTELEKSAGEINSAKIEQEVAKAMKEVQREMAGVQKELQQAMKDLNREQIRADVEASLAKVDFEKLKSQLEEIRQTDFSKIQKELEAIQPKLKKSMEEARAGMEQAKKEMLAYRDFINDLHRDGLINKNENYKIEWQNGTLTINGKKQAAETATKYNFLKGRKDFSIVKDADDFNIRNEAQ